MDFRIFLLLDVVLEQHLVAQQLCTLPQNDCDARGVIMIITYDSFTRTLSLQEALSPDILRYLLHTFAESLLYSECNH